MKATSSEVQEYLNFLGETIRCIQAVTSDVDEPRLQAKTNDDEWSVNDILAHLRSCADVWGESIEKMLVKDKQTLPYIHPRQWIKKTNYLDIPFQKSFKKFSEQRKRLLMLLMDLSFDDWSRSAIIQGRKHTIFTQVRRMAKHENEHCQQIEELLK